MENQSSSPLQKYLRQPKLYISLPSQGLWYAKNNIDKTEDIEVYSMTANDEISLKIPDGLYSGKVVTNLIKNCVPSIKDPWMMPMIDFDYVLAAVRMASYGDTITIDSACPECSNQDTYSVEVQGILNHIENAKFQHEINVDGFIFRIRPLYYKEVTELNKISMFVQRALAQAIPNIEDEDAKQEQIDLLFEKINNATKDAVTAGIVEIVTPEGESVTNPQFIRDFVLNSDGGFFGKIQDLYKQNTEALAIPPSEVECSECSHKYNVATNLDYSNFFGEG